MSDQALVAPVNVYSVFLKERDHLGDLGIDGKILLK
jgi:hypothetical protein